MLLLLAVSVRIAGKDSYTHLVVQRVYAYHSTIDTLSPAYRCNAYLNYQIKTEKKNITLLGVPRMYTFYNENADEYVGESLLQFTSDEKGKKETKVIARSSTIPHHRILIPNLYEYLLPDLYGTTLLNDQFLSPFNRRNRHFYKYKAIPLDEHHVRLEIFRKAPNTQAVRGHAIVVAATGRVVSCTLSCEYDMLSLETTYFMDDGEGSCSLHPKRSELKAKFTFLGNRMRARFTTTYSLPPLDSIPAFSSDQEERAFVESHRPDTLSTLQQELYKRYDADNAPAEIPADTIPPAPRKKSATDIIWKFISNNVIHHITGRFGSEDKGYFRLSPPLNPFYLGYSGRRGVYYRAKLRWGYEFNANRELNSIVKLGYSFKQRQLLINIPTVYYFDKRKNGYVKFHFINGERVTNTTVLEKLKEERRDSINFDAMDLDYFKHSYSLLMCHYDFNPYIGMETGITYNRWSSVEDKHFEAMDKPTIYNATSWVGTLTIRPLGWKGPILTVNYERTFRALSKKSMNFEKWEIDCSYLKPLPSLRTLSLRAGFGVYTSNMSKNYFLEFKNFSDNYIPGGWNDEWSGEFELLHSNWYNSSKYYVRMNATYESPLLLISRIPFVGTVIEKERLYLSALNLSHLSNYFELGYGFTNRVFSMGVFASFAKGAYDAIGVKFGFELFENW